MFEGITIIIHNLRIMKMFNDWFQLYLTSGFVVVGKYGVLSVLVFSYVLNIYLQNIYKYVNSYSNMRTGSNPKFRS